MALRSLMTVCWALFVLGLHSAETPTWADEVRIEHRTFVIPSGYQLQLAAQPPLTLRPICVDFDERGRIYVAESSGSNDDVKTQLQEKPHQILRLEDEDGDGVFDHRTIFAERMMFPEGALWHEGSLYVAAPPVIWKLTDTNDDGVADERQVWFDGKTLTGCANDLHGPFAGPDGWIYWCKGAFAEQVHERAGESPLVTRAAHIFRRRPEGGRVEAVMTGGMDNPVELAFSQGGERFFSTTFLQHPAGGQRDGLIHAIYGGVYGKRHGVLDGHPRTGDLLSPMTHLGAAAPSGLTMLRSTRLGLENQLVTACFNLHQVTRHQLVREGASFRTIDDNLVLCDDLDFHPTDVIEDADGSLLVVDTGGWYKLCCPTSQLPKPDVWGRIYRLSRRDAPRLDDPRGTAIDWRRVSDTVLVDHLGDPRPAVQQRAMSELARRGEGTVAELAPAVLDADQQLATNAVWTLCRIPSPRARHAVRGALRSSPSEPVLQAAIHSVSVWRDQRALPQLLPLLQRPSLHHRRAAAEAIGRLRNVTAVSSLLQAAAADDLDRILEHSLIYALIEINEPSATRAALEQDVVSVQRVGLMAMAQQAAAGLAPEDVCPLLLSPQATLREAATFIVAARAEWGEAMVEVFRRNLSSLGTPEGAALREQLERLGHIRPLQDLLAARLLADERTETKRELLNILRAARAEPKVWTEAAGELLGTQEPALVTATVQLMGVSTEGQAVRDRGVLERLAEVARSPRFEDEARLLAMRGMASLEAELFSFVVAKLAADQPAKHRALAVGLLEEADLTTEQLQQLTEQLTRVGPLELARVIAVFAKHPIPSLAPSLFKALAACPATASLPRQQVESLAEQFAHDAQPLLQSIFAAPSSLADQSQQLERYLRELPEGDIRRGQRIFHSEKMACFACHAMGYRGGTVGPDLSRIARIRSRRDLLEAILFPSRSFVRSYEPVIVVTSSGQAVSGTLVDQSVESLVLQLNATERRTVASSEVVEILPGKVSIMPAGIEKLMTEQELADLLTFLESRK